MARVVTFGEIMLRLSPPGSERFLQSPRFTATFGGAEANVAVSLAGFGIESWFVTRLPAHAIGDAALRALRAEGVRTEAILRGGERLGVYYTEAGASQRPPVVIYDRARSSFSEMNSGEIDWKPLFARGDWLHVTGITPALGANAAAATREAIGAARSAGAHVSIDLNFRRKLWSENEARAVMRPLVKDVDLLIANEDHLGAMLGVFRTDVPNTGGPLDTESSRVLAEQTSAEFGVEMLAMTHRDSKSASDNGWSAALWDRPSGSFHCSERYEIRLVDRLGGGDTFAAGLLYGLLTGRGAQGALRFAVAAGVLKHTIPGDFNRASVDEVDRLADGDASGRVQR